MKIYLSHSTSLDYHNMLYDPIQHSCLWSQHQWFLPHMTSLLPTHSKEIISEADLIMAEVSFPSTGMGIELGWAEMLSKPILFIHQKEVKLSSSLPLISSNFISYSDSDNMLNEMASFLQYFQP